MIPVVIHIPHRSSFTPDFICDDMLVADHHTGGNPTSQIPFTVLMLLIFLKKIT
jgi:hypothetical protein